jgi:hypothetical protein
MNHKIKPLVVLTISLILTLMMTGIVQAITITVDGTKEAVWDTGSGGQTPGSQLDANEAGIDDRYDIEDVRWTNDASGSAPWGNMYFLVETYSNLDTTYPPLSPQIIICIDTDNNTSTGDTASGFCNDIVGYDRRIIVDLVALSVLVRSWTGATWLTVPMPSGGMRSVAWDDTIFDGIADQPYIEIGIDLQSLGIVNSSTCLSTMPAAIYYDNGMADNEDTVPASGTFNIGCGTPTAVTLSQISTQALGYQWTIAAAGTISLAGVGTAVFVHKRRKVQS